MHVVARPGRQPFSNLEMLMGGVVVHHQVDVQVPRHVGIDMVEEPQELLMSVAGLASGQYLSGSNVQGGKERGGAVAHVVVGHALHVSQAHGQDGLRAVQGLNLALFVHTQHHGFVRWVEIEPHNVPDLLHEEGVGGELEMLLAMGLEAESPPETMHRSKRNPGFGGQGTAGPMGTGLGLGHEGLPQQGGHLFVADGPGRSRSGFFIQADETLAQEAPAPFTHGGAGQTQLNGDSAVVEAVGGQQDDLGPLGQGLGERPGTGHSLQLLSHPGIYSHCWNRSTKRHGFSFHLKKPTTNKLHFKAIYETKH